LRRIEGRVRSRPRLPAKKKGNKKVSLHNRIKIFRFMDYLETGGVSPPRRIRYLIELTKLASMLSIDFEKASRSDIEKVILEHRRLDVSENTKADFKVTVKRFYKRLRGSKRRRVSA
jgi:hypothetical protein